MHSSQYQTEVLRTANIEIRSELEILSELGLGITGEAGEVADIIKKHLYQGHKMDVEHLAEELGDVCWYIAVLSDIYGFQFEELFDRNIAKLRKRYPDGFSAEQSINRSE